MPTYTSSTYATHSTWYTIIPPQWVKSPVEKIVKVSEENSVEIPEQPSRLSFYYKYGI